MTKLNLDMNDDLNNQLIVEQMKRGVEHLRSSFVGLRVRLGYSDIPPTPIDQLLLVTLNWMDDVLHQREPMTPLDNLVASASQMNLTPATWRATCDGYQEMRKQMGDQGFLDFDCADVDDQDDPCLLHTQWWKIGD